MKIILILSGNLSFLNWLTALPAIFCFDDKFCSILFSVEDINKVKSIESNYQKYSNRLNSSKSNFVYNIVKKYLSFELSWVCITISVRRVTGLIMIIFIGYLSIPVINNILSPNQRMNINFNSFRLVNSYGAFGSVTKVRHEVYYINFYTVH